jgi:uncharacterized membrane protein
MHLSGTPEERRTRQTLLRTGLVFGVGIVGTLDEVLLHQLLQWHNLYVHTTPYWRTFIDGLFHLATATLLGLGAAQLWRQRRLIAGASNGRALAAGIFLGMGGFNLYDGTIQHKVLHLHPVREGVADLLPYDLAFNGVAVALLIIGWVLWRSARDRSPRRPR